MLIEKIAGRPWGTDMEERFFKPLGLTRTYNCIAEPIIPRRARGYEKSGPGWINAPYLAMSQPYAAGAICSTVGDMARWNRALHTGRVVSAESYRLMTTPEGAAARSESRYGFGLSREKMGELDVVEHGGGIHGFVSANAWVPAPELSLTVLANAGSARSDELLRQVARAVMGIPLVQPPRVVPLAAADRARYVGVYTLPLPPGPRAFTVSETADGLTGQLEGQGPIPLLHYGDHTFGASFDASVRLIFTLEGNRATKMALQQGGRRIEGPRK
jgi:CubicO group peptidase (beta-lactamase class C family)